MIKRNEPASHPPPMPSSVKLPPGTLNPFKWLQDRLDRFLDLYERYVTVREREAGMDIDTSEYPQQQIEPAPSPPPRETPALHIPRFVDGEWVYITEDYAGYYLNGYAAYIDAVSQQPGGVYYSVYVRIDDAQMVNYTVPESILRPLTEDEEQQLQELNPLYAEWKKTNAPVESSDNR